MAGYQSHWADWPPDRTGEGLAHTGRANKQYNAGYHRGDTSNVHRTVPFFNARFFNVRCHLSVGCTR
jgi:hypothetical protein